MDRDRKRKVGSDKARMKKKKNLDKNAVKGAEWTDILVKKQQPRSQLRVTVNSKGPGVVMMTQVTLSMLDSFLGCVRRNIVSALCGSATCGTRCCLL